MRPSRRLEVLAKRDGGICQLCFLPVTNREEWSPDHKIPVSHGGTDSIMNLRFTHRSCNSRRGTSECPRCAVDPEACRRKVAANWEQRRNVERQQRKVVEPLFTEPRRDTVFVAANAPSS